MSKKVEIKLGFDKEEAAKEAQLMEKIMQKALTGKVDIDISNAQKRLKELQATQQQWTKTFNKCGQIKIEAEDSKKTPKQVIDKMYSEAEKALQTHKERIAKVSKQVEAQPENKRYLVQLNNAKRLRDQQINQMKQLNTIRSLIDKKGSFEAVTDNSMVQIKLYNTAMTKLKKQIAEIQKYSQMDGGINSTADYLGVVDKTTKKTKELNQELKKVQKEQKKLEVQSEVKQDKKTQETSQSGLGSESSTKDANKIVENAVKDVNTRLDQVAESVDKITQQINEPIKEPTEEKDTSKTEEDKNSQNLTKIISQISKIEEKLAKMDMSKADDARYKKWQESTVGTKGVKNAVSSYQGVDLSPIEQQLEKAAKGTLNGVRKALSNIEMIFEQIQKDVAASQGKISKASLPITTFKDKIDQNARSDLSADKGDSSARVVMKLLSAANALDNITRNATKIATLSLPAGNTSLVKAENTPHGTQVPDFSSWQKQFESWLDSVNAKLKRISSSDSVGSNTKEAAKQGLNQTDYIAKTLPTLNTSSLAEVLKLISTLPFNTVRNSLSSLSTLMQKISSLSLSEANAQATQRNNQRAYSQQRIKEVKSQPLQLGENALLSSLTSKVQSLMSEAFSKGLDGAVSLLGRASQEFENLGSSLNGVVDAEGDMTPKFEQLSNVIASFNFDHLEKSLQNLANVFDIFDGKIPTVSAEEVAAQKETDAYAAKDTQKTFRSAEEEAEFRAAQRDYIAAINQVIAAMDKLTEKELEAAKFADDPESATEQAKLNKAHVEKGARTTKGTTNSVDLDTLLKATQQVQMAMSSGILKNVSEFEMLINTLKDTFREGTAKQREVYREAKEASKQQESSSKVSSERKAEGKEVKNLSSMYDKLFKSLKQVDGINKAITKSTRKIASGYKEVGRVVQGILISRLFYTMLSGASNVIAAVKDMITQFENAHVSMTILLRDQEKATALMSDLQDFAAVTPFSNADADKEAQRLLAYGFEAENVLSVMQDLADASAATGDTDTFDRVAKALGQINTKGKLAVQEILQLTEAGIPTYQILQEELGLTADQMANIGKQGISSSVAIRAILNGIEKRFGGAADALSHTMTGLWSTIKDDTVFFANDLFSSVSAGFREILEFIAQGLDSLREIMATSGIGGLFEAIVPPELQESLRLLAANLHILLQVIVMVVQALSPYLTAAFSYVIDVLNMLVPIISAVGYVLSYLLAIVSRNTQGLYSLARALALLTVGIVVYKVMTQLYKVMSTLYTSCQALFAGCKLLFVGFAELAQGLCTVSQFATVCGGTLLKLLAIIMLILAYFKLFDGVFEALFGGISESMTDAFNIDPSKYFTPTVKKAADAVYDFDKAFDPNAVNDWKDSVDDAADSAKKAAKVADNLQSFDEVFTIKDDSDVGGAADGAADEIADLSDLMGGMDGLFNGYNFDPVDWDQALNLGGLDDGITSLQEALNRINPNNSMNKAMEKLKENATNLISPLTNLGTSLAEYSNEDFQINDPLEFAKDGWPSLNYLCDGGIEELSGFQEGVAGIMAIVAGLFTLDPDLILEGWNSLVNGLGTMSLGVVNILAGIPGLVADAFVKLGQWLQNLDWGGWITKGLGKMIEGLGVTLREGIKGLKGIFGGIIDVFIGALTFNPDKIKEGSDKVVEGLKTIGEGIATGLKDMFVGFGELLWGLVVELFDFLIPGAGEKLEEIRQNIADFFTGIIDKVIGFKDSVIEWITTLWTNCGESITGFISSVITYFTDFFGSLLSDFTEFVSNIISNVVDFFAQIVQKVEDFFSERLDSLYVFITDVKQKVSDFVSEVKDKIVEFFGNVKQKAGELFTDIKDKVVNFFKNVKDQVVTFFNDNLNKIAFWVGSVKDKILTFFGNILSHLGTFLSNLKNAIFNGLQNIFDSIGQAGSWLFNKAAEIGSNLVKGIWNGISNVKEWILNKIKGFGNDILDGLKNFFGIHSPSKVMADEVGQYLPLGIAEGIKDSKDSVLDSLQDVVDDARNIDTEIDSDVNVDKNIQAGENNLSTTLSSISATFINDLFDGFTWLAENVQKLFDKVDITGTVATLNTVNTQANKVTTQSQIPTVGGLLYKNQVEKTYSQTRVTKLTEEDIAALTTQSADPVSLATTQPGTSEVHLHVGVLVADDKGLAKLNKELKRIQNDESRGRR